MQLIIEFSLFQRVVKPPLHTVRVYIPMCCVCMHVQYVCTYACMYVTWLSCDCHRSIVRHALESVMMVCITHTHPIPRSSIFHEGYVHLADHFGDEEEKVRGG